MYDKAGRQFGDHVAGTAPVGKGNTWPAPQKDRSLQGKVLKQMQIINTCIQITFITLCDILTNDRESILGISK